jgi:formamidopyrimidine-DNA glycosylase
LGEGRIILGNEIPDFFKDIGPEPWPDKLAGGLLQKRFHVKKNSPIKNAALSQNIIAGIGNILVCESLFKSKISPLKKVSELTDKEWDLWSEKIVETINLIIDKESSDEIVYVSEGGENIFEVYSREGEGCFICCDKIRRIKQSGRSTFYCPTCQKI